MHHRRRGTAAGMLKARPRWNANTGLGGFANMGRRLGASALVKLCAVVGLVLLGVPADSLAPPERVCGDGKCQNPENSETCPADCGSGGGGDPEPELACNILDSNGNHFCDLAFVAKLNNKNQGIYLSADDGSGLVKLLEHVVPGLGARWLPDGDRVGLYRSECRTWAGPRCLYDQYPHRRHNPCCANGLLSRECLP